MTFEQFIKDDKTAFAVIRALEIIGEATINRMIGYYSSISTNYQLEGIKCYR